jgi:hypothetical protein
MDKKTLVNEDVPNGAKLVEALDQAGIPIPAAFWYYSTDRGEWRLVLGTPLFDRKGPIAAYTAVQAVLLQMPEIASFELDNISIVSARDQIVRVLASAWATGPGIHNLRYTQRALQNVVIEDVLIYRLDIPKKRPLTSAKSAEGAQEREPSHSGSTRVSPKAS